MESADNALFVDTNLTRTINVPSPSISQEPHLRDAESNTMHGTSCMTNTLLTPPSPSDSRRFSFASSQWSTDSFGQSFSSQSSLSSPQLPSTPVYNCSIAQPDDFVMICDELGTESSDAIFPNENGFSSYYDAPAPLLASTEGLLRQYDYDCSSGDQNASAYLGLSQIGHEGVLSASRDLSSAFEACLDRQTSKGTNGAGIGLEVPHGLNPWPSHVETNLANSLALSPAHLRSPFEDDRPDHVHGFDWRIPAQFNQEEARSTWNYLPSSRTFADNGLFMIKEESMGDVMHTIDEPGPAGLGSPCIFRGARLNPKALNENCDRTKSEKRFPKYSQVQKAIGKWIPSSKTQVKVTKKERNGPTTARRKPRREKITLPSKIDFTYELPEANSKKVTCPTCGKPFERREHMHRHEITVHSQDKPWKCWVCPADFSRGDNFSSHLLTHVKLNSRAKNHQVDPETLKQEILERETPERAARLVGRIDRERAKITLGREKRF